MGYDFGCFDEEQVRLEAAPNPFATAVLPTSPVKSVTQVCCMQLLFLVKAAGVRVFVRFANYEMPPFGR